jgi:hypothetical protein
VINDQPIFDTPFKVFIYESVEQIIFSFNSQPRVACTVRLSTIEPAIERPSNVHGKLEVPIES